MGTSSWHCSRLDSSSASLPRRALAADHIKRFILFKGGKRVLQAKACSPLTIKCVSSWRWCRVLFVDMGVSEWQCFGLTTYFCSGAEVLWVHVYSPYSVSLNAENGMSVGRWPCWLLWSDLIIVCIESAPLIILHSTYFIDCKCLCTMHNLHNHSPHPSHYRNVTSSTALKMDPPLSDGSSSGLLSLVSFFHRSSLYSGRILLLHITPSSSWILFTFFNSFLFFLF